MDAARLRRPATALLGALVLVLGLVPALADPAHAVPGITVAAGGPVVGTTGAPIPIPSVQVTGTGTTPVQLGVAHGTLALTTTTGLTFTGPSSGATLRFSGTVADVNAALATLRYTPTGPGTDTLEVALVAADHVYLHSTGHLYGWVAANLTWSDAATAATGLTRAGAPGYLTTVTTAAETGAIDRLGQIGWIAATDDPVEGTWRWEAGPETGQQFWQGTTGGTALGYSHWGLPEPNAHHTNEDCAVVWLGFWDDTWCSYTIFNGYYVEYGTPGALPDVASASLGITVLQGQTISFAGPAGATVGTPVTLGATATSGLPVAFASSTPAVCAVTGTTLTPVGAGSCTVTATQPGDGTYAAAAPVPVTFTVAATTPGAPTIVSLRPGEARVTLSFTPPPSDGGAAIDGYRLTVSPGDRIVTTTTSPVTITGLRPGVRVTVAIAAENAAGTGPAASAQAIPGDVDQGTLAGGRLISGGAPDRPAVPDAAVGAARAATGSWVALVTGEVLPIGGAPDLGGVARPAGPIVDIASTPAGDGYWLTEPRGGVYAFGTAVFHGSASHLPLVAPVTALTAAPDGGGYWLVARDGGVFAFGSARFHGSMAGVALAAPIVGLVPMPSGDGYWLVAADGGVFAFGDAPFLGSAAGLRLAAPIVAAVATPSRAGYWLVASDGGVFTFGDAEFHGSAADRPGAPIVGLRPTDGGYEEIRADGTVEAFR